MAHDLPLFQPDNLPSTLPTQEFVSTLLNDDYADMPALRPRTEEGSIAPEPGLDPGLLEDIDLDLLLDLLIDSDTNDMRACGLSEDSLRLLTSPENTKSRKIYERHQNAFLVYMK